MKAIIIEEDRFTEILEHLKYQSESMSNKDEAARHGIEPQIWEKACHAAHRNLHFHLVRWMQSHGAKCIRID